MKIGILTSGGDCPGLNAVIRGAVLKGVISHDAEFVGFRWGWKGVVEHGGAPWLLAWRWQDENGRFLGELSDPLPLEVGADGSLSMATAMSDAGRA